jgi:hypothetical protein
MSDYRIEPFSEKDKSTWLFGKLTPGLRVKVEAGFWITLKKYVGAGLRDAARETGDPKWKQVVNWQGIDGFWVFTVSDGTTLAFAGGNQIRGAAVEVDSSGIKED